MATMAMVSTSDALEVTNNSGNEGSIGTSTSTSTSTDHILTCVTCGVWFKTNDAQRSHYKTDWHRYNLKRKVAGIPPVDAETFARRVIAQRAQAEAAVAESKQGFEVC